MRRLWSSWALITVATLAIALPAAAQSDEYTYVRIVRLSLVEGDVQILRPGESQWESALMNLPIRHGYTLATGRGRAEVEFENGATARLAENTTLNFTELALAGGGRITRLTLRQGTASFYANLSRNDVFEVHTPHLMTAITDDARYRLDVTAEGSWVSVWKGDIQVASAAGGATRVTKGRGAFVSAFNTADLQLIRNAEPDSWDRWVSERDDVILSATNAALRYTNSPYRYGHSDLYYYGNWFNVPGYGQCWQPYGTPFGWSPFWNGRWVYHGFGWTWVSYEPWGWLPYHFGRWAHVPGRGWVWVPGYFHYWDPAPVHWVQVGGHVGWVPRSPHDRPGNPPTNLPGGTVVNTPGGVIGGSPNQRTDLNPNDRPVFLDRPPLDDGIPIRPRGPVGRIGRDTPLDDAVNPPSTTGTPATGFAGRPTRPISPDEPAIVYDKDGRRFINNPRAPVRPADSDEPGNQTRPARPTAPPGPAARPAPATTTGTIGGGPPRTDPGPRTQPERPRIFEPRVDDKPERMGGGQIGAPRPDSGRPTSPSTQPGWGSRPTPPPSQPRVDTPRPSSPPPPRMDPPRPAPTPPPAPRPQTSPPPAPRPPSGGESRPAPPPARPPVKPPGN
jgi:hypothetical protein